MLFPMREMEKMIDLDLLFKIFNSNENYFSYQFDCNDYAVVIWVGRSISVLSKPERRDLSLNQYTCLSFKFIPKKIIFYTDEQMHKIFGFRFEDFPFDTAKWAREGCRIPIKHLITMLNKLETLSTSKDAGDGE